MGCDLLWKGDVEKGFAAADNVYDGEMRVGGQEHFYLETQVIKVTYSLGLYQKVHKAAFTIPN